MRGRKRESVGDDLARGEREFANWRRARKFPARIPDRLWAWAVQLAAIHGVHRTARTLSLDYYTLKERVEKQQAASANSPSARPVATFYDATSASMIGLLKYGSGFPFNRVAGLQGNLEIPLPPADWMPWNYREALDAAQQAA